MLKRNIVVIFCFLMGSVAYGAQQAHPPAQQKSAAAASAANKENVDPIMKIRMALCSGPGQTGHLNGAQQKSAAAVIVTDKESLDPLKIVRRAVCSSSGQMGVLKAPEKAYKDMYAGWSAQDALDVAYKDLFESSNFKKYREKKNSLWVNESRVGQKKFFPIAVKNRFSQETRMVEHQCVGVKLKELGVSEQVVFMWVPTGKILGNN